MEQSRKRFGAPWWATVTIAVLLALLFAVETPLSAYAASEKGKYIKEVIMITAANKTEAENKLKQINEAEIQAAKDVEEANKSRAEKDKVPVPTPKTYYLYETPIYSCGKPEKRETYLAYTTTNNKANAIKSIKTMNMTGGWSYEEYDKYLATLKDEANFLASDLYNAILEFAEVVKDKDNKNAQYAKRILDYFYEDDSKLPLSEFFIKMAEKEDYEKVKDEMLTFTMQANSDILATVECALMIACADAYVVDGNDINFLTGMQRQTFLNGLTGFLDGTAYAQYDVYVQDILTTLPDVQADIKYYMSSPYKLEGDVAEIAALLEQEILAGLPEESETPREDYLVVKKDVYDIAVGEKNEFKLTKEQQEAARKLVMFDEYYNGLSQENQSRYTSGKVLYTALSECKYLGYEKGNDREYENLLGLIMAHDKMSDYKNEDFYPLINKLTPGQRALLKVGFSQLVSSITVSTDTMENTLDGLLVAINETAETEKDKIKKGDVVSVYNGVDRSLFMANNGIALTSEAIDAAYSKPFVHVETSAEKMQSICEIVAIASGCVAAVSLLTTAGFTTAAYLSLQAQFAEASLEMIAVNVDEFLSYSATWTMEYMGQSAVTEAAFQRGAGWAITQTLNGVSVSASNTAATFSRTLVAFLRVGLGTVLNWINIVSIGVLIIVLIIDVLAPMIAGEDDAAYIDIPRVMCAYQEIFGQKEEVGKDKEYDYIYYYGVKNPLLTKDDKARAANVPDENGKYTDILLYGIGDVSDWRLKGLSRQWVALYTSTDSKSGLPILADSLKVVTSTDEFNKDSSFVSVKKFNSNSAFDFHYAYGITKKEDVTPSYLGYKMETTESTQSGSAFSDFTLWGGIIAGLVVGGGAGALVTYGVIRKRKKKSAQ